VGNRGTVIGGKAGNVGFSGVGGTGGSGFIYGDDGIVIGGDGDGDGDGGSGPNADGRGGKAPLGPTAKLGFSTATWGIGAAGAGANHPGYNRRLRLLQKYSDEFKARFPDRANFINAGVDRVPRDWINQRLNEEGEKWSVDAGSDGFVLPSLF
jgi:hypothetical protein